MNKIKSCPFCGTEVELSKNPLWHGGHGYYNCFEFEIVCPKCGCNVRYDKNDTIYRTEEEAIQNVINAWNKREDYCADGVNEVIDKIKDAFKIIDKYEIESKDKCKKCEYYRNPDYTRCHKCKMKSEDKK